MELPEFDHLMAAFTRLCREKTRKPSRRFQTSGRVDLSEQPSLGENAPQYVSLGCAQIQKR